ncbi:MAG: hypothetical protein DRP08_01540 [Candidatus Aenigmatarchaeota archaeon]|nr:MAG: hypothetical protein DRP08_01540 [Candidatus Aenigmarchaeota archaeon]
MKLLRVVVKCPKCGSEEVKIEKVLRYSTEEERDKIIIRETLCHDGFGWDLNTFTIKCAKCGTIIEEVALEDIDKDDKLGGS